MRITVDIDEEVLWLLEERRQASGTPRDAIINEVLRAALAPSARTADGRLFRTFSVGGLLMDDLDDVTDVLSRLS